MGIRAVIAAAAVMVGVGQAEAATANIVGTLVTSEYSAGPIGDHDSWEIWTLPDYKGIPIGVPLPGVLSLTEKAFNGTIRPWANLVVDGTMVYDFAVDGDLSGLYGIHPNHIFAYSSLHWNGDDGYFEYSSDMGSYMEYTRLEFTLAPVPLPATAALLPLGIGALALMRRRRQAG